MRILFKQSYEDDIRLFKHSGSVFWYGLLAIAVLAAPFLLDEFYVGELYQVYIWAIGGLGLMLLAGYTGQVSLGHAAFLAIGAYVNAWLANKGLPFPVTFLAAGFMSALAGMIIAVPAARMTGVYLAIATLAFALIVEETIKRWESVTGGAKGMTVDAPNMFGYELWDITEFYFLCLGVLVLVIFACLNLLRSPTGRAMMAIRDSEVSAQSMGVNLVKYKTIAFAISAFITGLAGALMGYKDNFVSYESFNFIISLQLLLMVVVGGLGSIHGAIFGAIFIGGLPQVLAIARDNLPQSVAEQVTGLEGGIFGLILILFILFEPLGLYGRWVKIKHYFSIFPLYRTATFKRQKAYLKTERMK